MDSQVRGHFNNLTSADDQTRLKALRAVLHLTDRKVPWVYEVWDDLVGRLDDPNSYQRSIAIMVLCNLAKSDTEGRLEHSLAKILEHTKDEKFITSRQCIQNIWKVAAADRASRDRVLKHLGKRFNQCAEEKHYNLIRQDIIQALRSLHDNVADEGVLKLGTDLIEREKEAKHRKKYEAVLLS